MRERACQHFEVVDLGGGTSDYLVDREQEPLLEKFEVIVEDGVGFELYEAVERTKRALSEALQASLTLHYPGAELDRLVQRSEFTESAERPVARIVEALERTLERGGVRGEDVQIACLTGGTSRVPIVREALTARLPHAQQRTLRSFHSVVHGLSVCSVRASVT